MKETDATSAQAFLLLLALTGQKWTFKFKWPGVLFSAFAAGDDIGLSGWY
ncbi:MAG: hypothetical protein ACYC05_00550 [Sulfuricella sp.]